MTLNTSVLRIAVHWLDIRRVLIRGQASTIYCSVASINPNGTPHVTPLGTFFLRDDLTSYHFDHCTSALPRNLDNNPNLCVMAVNAGFMF